MENPPSTLRHHSQHFIEAGRSWTYPFRGVIYFATHKFLWPLLLSRLLPCFILSFVVLSILFTFTYLPQVAFLAVFHHSLAWINGAFLVLGEGAVIIQCIWEAFMCDETLVDVFDAILVQQGLTDLVSQSRLMNEEETDSLRKLGKPTESAVYSPFSFLLICEFILFLPLNLIPIFGVPLFLLLTGRRAGPLHHWRYFKLLRLTKKQRLQHIKDRRLQYTLFGTSALVLQLLPGISMFFLLTTATGSALWVVRLETKRRLEFTEAAVSPEYHDEET